MKNMLIFLLLFVLIIGIVRGEINCLQSQGSGNDIKIYYFDNEDNCKKSESCQLVVKKDSGCTIGENEVGERVRCYKRGLVMEYSDCKAKTCDNCQTQIVAGRCRDYAGVHIKVDGCSYGDTANAMFIIGGSMSGIGIVLCACCLWICIPLGIFSILLGCCVACC